MLQNTLRNIFKTKAVVVGMGNPLRGDDGLGPALVERLKGRVKALCLNVANTPENYTGKIIQEDPENILIIDALHLGLKAGAYAFLTKEDIIKCGFSTHDISPHMFIKYLQDNTHADIYILGVQPKNISLGEEMSESVKKALEEITDLIMTAHN